MKKPQRQQVQNPPTPQGGNQYFIKNDFHTETWMNAPHLVELRERAPEAYELYLQEVRLNGEANRDFQKRSQDQDDTFVPKLINNDRWGLGLSTFMVVGSLALSAYSMYTGQSFWWVPLTLNAIAPIVSAIRGKKGS